MTNLFRHRPLIEQPLIDRDAILRRIKSLEKVSNQEYIYNRQKLACINNEYSDYIKHLYDALGQIRW